MPDLQTPTNKAITEVAIAIIPAGDRFLMQLRDNIPGIYYPGYWGFFGGHLDPGETPAITIQRELVEEIAFAAPEIKFWRTYPHSEVLRHVFIAPLTVPLESLVLGEGWDLGLLSREDILRGDRYSEKAQQVRPLGQPHQRILLDFLDGETISSL
jgi:8-oxo-dGTP pyrophosphatase MutT (NUDIX family)